jgi:hypothetical protein
MKIPFGSGFGHCMQRNPQRHSRYGWFSQPSSEDQPDEKQQEKQDQRENERNQDDQSVDSNATVCPHLFQTKSTMGMVCTDCGLVVSELDYSSEGCSEMGGRCQLRSGYQRSVDDVFIKNNIEVLDSSVLDQVDQKYKTIVTAGDKVRSASRDALIAVCFRFYLMKQGDCRPLSDLQKMFHVSRRYLSTSLTKFYKSFPQERVVYPHPKDLVKRTLLLQNLDVVHLKPIQRLCELAEGKSKKLNRSTPQSVASAMVFVYLKYQYGPSGDSPENRLAGNRKKFAQAVYLSDITIDKLVKEIESLFSE